MSSEGPTATATDSWTATGLGSRALGRLRHEEVHHRGVPAGVYDELERLYKKKQQEKDMARLASKRRVKIDLEGLCLYLIPYVPNSS